VHAREKASVEVTDLGVDPAHRQHGIGKLLLASAARTGLQSGKSKVTLAAQDAVQRPANAMVQGHRLHPTFARFPAVSRPTSRL